MFSYATTYPFKITTISGLLFWRGLILFPGVRRAFPCFGQVFHLYFRDQISTGLKEVAGGNNVRDVVVAAFSVGDLHVVLLSPFD